MRINQKKSFYESFADNLRVESALKESCNKKVNEDALEPKYSGKKSFYGKADVRKEGDAKILKSYDTDVVKIEGDEITVLCEPEDLTQTTLRHIREFLQQEGFEPLTRQELLKLANGEELKESYNDLDVDIHLLTNQRDYSIVDMSEIVDKKDGDVLPPMEDIATLLVGADEDLTESYGSNWGHINIQSTRLYEADRSSNALFELRLPGNKNYLMSMILDESNSGKTLKVNNTLGKTIFQRKTNDPKRAIVEYIQQYLPANLNEAKNEAKKEGKNNYKNEIESLLTSNMGYANLYAHYQEVLAMISVYKELDGEEKEVMKKIVSRLAYRFVPELSSKIYPENPNEEDKTEYPTFDKMVEDLFGKDWVREPEEQKQYEVPANEESIKLKESDEPVECRIYVTSEVAPGKYKSTLYDTVNDCDKADDIVAELKAQGLNASYDTIWGNEDPDYDKNTDETDWSAEEASDADERFENRYMNGGNGASFSGLYESYAIVNYYKGFDQAGEKIFNGATPKSVENKVRRFAEKDDIEIESIHQVSSDLKDSEYLNSLGRGIQRLDYNNSTFEESNIPGENNGSVTAKIYQIDNIGDCPYAFMRYDYAEGKLSLDDYQEVATIELPKSDYILDNIFRIGNTDKSQFNITKPMRSISVSDIIEIDGKKYYVDDFGFKEIGSGLSESSRLVETTRKGIETKKQDLYGRIRQALKDAGDKDWENIVGYTKRLPKDVVAKFDKEEDEIWCIEMIHSILTYTSNRNVDELINDRYLKKYVDEFGEDKVRELLANEIDEYNKATINQDVYTDSEGLTYNSVTFSDDLDESNLKEADGEEVPTEEPEAEVEPTNTDDLNTDEPKQGLGTGYATFVRHPKDIADVRNSVKQGITDGKTSYVVCSTEKLSSEEFDDLCNDLTVNRDFCTGFTPIDDVNYAFNCIQVEGDGKDFKLLIDPSGFAYPRWVAVLDNK